MPSDKRGLVWVLLLVLITPHIVFAEDPVFFADALLKTQVEDTLGVYDPTPTDMQNLTSLIISNSDIRDLCGLEYAINLEKLYAAYNNIHSISDLSGLSNLRELDINNNHTVDISPVAGLHQLTFLNIHQNGIKDISALAGLSRLRELIIRLNQVRDISVLPSLSNLVYLDARQNQIRDLPDLTNMAKLDRLYLTHNNIRNISPLSGLQNIGQLWLDHNLIEDLSPLTSISSLRRLYVKGNPLNDAACSIHIPQIYTNNPGIYFSHPTCVERNLTLDSTNGGAIGNPGEGCFVYGGRESVLVSAIADPGFRFVGFVGTVSTIQNPIQIDMFQDHSLVAVFESVLDTIYVDCNAPGDPAPGDTAVSDLQENGTPSHPYDSIQEAVNVAKRGALISISSGVYTENIVITEKSVTLMGDPFTSDNEIVPNYPVIAGQSANATVTLSRITDPQGIILDNLVITGGNGEVAGALLCESSHVTMHHCLLVGNNTSLTGGGAVNSMDSDLTIINCTLADNENDLEGAGMYLINSRVAIMNTILWDNYPQEIVTDEGTDLSVAYSNIRGGFTGIENINCDPLFISSGAWTYTDDPIPNTDPITNHQIWVNGDYHLDPLSCCIDAGDPNASPEDEPEPNGGLINIGAYGGTKHACRSVH